MSKLSKDGGVLEHNWFTTGFMASRMISFDHHHRGGITINRLRLSLEQLRFVYAVLVPKGTETHPTALSDCLQRNFTLLAVKEVVQNMSNRYAKVFDEWVVRTPDYISGKRSSVYVGTERNRTISHWDYLQMKDKK